MASIGTFNGVSGSNDFVGIDEKGMSNLKNDLSALEKGVEKIINEMTQAEMKDAFKGAQFQKAVSEFIAAVRDEGKEWTSHINEYCDRIDTILSAMKTSQTQVASGIDSATKSVSNQTSVYNYGGGSSSAS